MTRKGPCRDPILNLLQLFDEVSEDFSQPNLTRQDIVAALSLKMAGTISRMDCSQCRKKLIKEIDNLPQFIRDFIALKVKSEQPALDTDRITREVREM
jgi:hypothetical protein